MNFNPKSKIKFLNTRFLNQAKQYPKKYEQHFEIHNYYKTYGLKTFFGETFHKQSVISFKSAFFE